MRENEVMLRCFERRVKTNMKDDGKGSINK
jgi:hypothetical protein